MDRIFGSSELILKKYNMDFALFGKSHIIVFLISIFFWIFIPFIMNKCSEKTKYIFRVSLALAMFLTEMGWYFWAGFGGRGLSPIDSLPLHLCSFALYSSIILLLTGKKLFFDLTYFWGLGGALQAIITPSVGFDFPNFRFFHFFFIHGTLVLVPLYFIFVEKYKINWKSFLRASIGIIIVMIFVMGINFLLGSNYMFVNKQPDFASMIDIFVKYIGPWPWYILGLYGMGLTVFLILYLPFLIIEIKNKIKK